MGALVQESSSLRRGVAKYRRKLLGRNAYVAVTSRGVVLNGAIYLVSDEMDDAALVVWLRAELDRVDPPMRHLQLLPRTVEAAIDGPSPNHPAIALVEEAQLEAIVDAPAQTEPWFHAVYSEGHIMRGVCERLSRAADPST